VYSAHMKKMVFYLRVSTSKQGADGNGIQHQMTVVNRYAELNEGEVIGQFVEVESGGKTDAERPQLSLALEICRKQNAVLICSKIDRLSRNAEFLLRLMNSKVEFICCDIPNCDRFTISLFAILAEKERMMISERTKNALQMVKARGIKLGGPNPELSVKLMNDGASKAKNEFRIKITPIIDDIKKAGVKTLQGLADCLNRRGISSRTGKSWTPSLVRNVLI
jgi:DNA invertase Pin-like site-specific DNA recombinase